jgi:hypothetical protein
VVRRVDDEAPQYSRDTGANAYHEADEGWSGKRVVLNYGGKGTDCGEARLRIMYPFWESEDEEMAYVKAVRSCPLSQYGSLDFFAYLREVASVAHALPGGLPTMPHVRMSRAERDRQLAKLRAQAKPSLPADEDYV